MITTQQIEQTAAFQSLDKFVKNLLIKKANRVQIERAVIHYNATGEIMDNIGMNNTKILKEIIESKTIEDLIPYNLTLKNKMLKF